MRYTLVTIPHIVTAFVKQLHRKHSGKSLKLLEMEDVNMDYTLSETSFICKFMAHRMMEICQRFGIPTC